MTAATRKVVIPASIAETAAAPLRAAEVDSRTRALLRGPIVPTLLRLAWPNILVMLAQASTGLIETWWVSHLGTDALAGMALVFPVVMLMQMVSAGAMGGGISSAVARALGAGRRDEADAQVLQRRLRRQCLALAYERAGERDPRHRQHAGAGDSDLCGRGHSRSALA